MERESINGSKRVIEENLKDGVVRITQLDLDLLSWAIPKTRRPTLVRRLDSR